MRRVLPTFLFLAVAVACGEDGQGVGPNPNGGGAGASFTAFVLSRTELDAFLNDAEDRNVNGMIDLQDFIGFLLGGCLRMVGGSDVCEGVDDPVALNAFFSEHEVTEIDVGSASSPWALVYRRESDIAQFYFESAEVADGAHSLASYYTSNPEVASCQPEIFCPEK